MRQEVFVQAHGFKYTPVSVISMAALVVSAAASGRIFTWQARRLQELAPPGRSESGRFVATSCELAQDSVVQHLLALLDATLGLLMCAGVILAYAGVKLYELGRNKRS